MQKMLPFTFIVMALLMSQTSIEVSGQDGLPPIIDREIFFGNPEIAGAQLSPDGQYMTFMKPYKDVRNIWVKKADEPFDVAKPITADQERPIPGYFWSRDSKYLLYVQDKGGDENYHVYALDPFGEPVGEDQVPEARNLTDVDDVRALIYRTPRTDPSVMYVGLNDRDKAWHDLYKVDIATGERELIRENHDRITNWIFDTKDEMRMATRTADDGSTEFLIIEGDEFKQCYSCGVLETCYVSRFHKDGDKVYFVSNKGDLDLTQFMLFDPKSGEMEMLEKDPKGQVDFGGAVYSRVSETLIATSYTGDKTEIYFKDKEFEKEYNWLKAQLPGSELNFGSSTTDERKWLVYANSDTDPGATYLFDRDAQTLIFQYRPRPKLPIDDLAHMKPVRFKSSDGLEIPAYLTTPKGVEAKDLPAVIVPHGGPWARDYWGYNSYHQFLANRGYAVLSINFRGSTGYGKAFLNAGNGEWGQLMQDDITWGAKYLVEEGIAAEDKIGIRGGSYGGYATLAGLTFTPDVYAAGVSIVGPSNLLTLLESMPPYWEQIRKMFHQRMGDPATEEGEALLKKQSPLFSAHKISKPLMVVQGANDPRVKKAESDQIVVAMRELDLPVEYICAPDEGHGFSRPENNMAYLAAAEKFLAKHLGGRYQAEMPDHIAKRLEEITVDINTVTMPEKVDESKLMAALPTPVLDLQDGKADYKMMIKMGTQEIPMEVTQQIEEIDGHWVVTQSATTPMGDMFDQFTLAKGSLQPMSRKVEQGPMKVSLEYGDEAITGTMSMNGSDQPLTIAIENDLFADGAALYETLARLELSDGFNAVYRIFDLQMQKVRPFEMEVVALENVDVPAGSYEAYKVAIKPLDDNPGEATVWLSADTANPCLVKSSTTMPQMGGATMTMELSTPGDIYGGSKKD